MSRRAALALAGLALAAVVLAEPARDGLAALVPWARGAGALGVLAFAAAYVVAALLLLPAWPLTLGAGFAWGFGPGVLLVSPVSVGAACAAFGLGRTLGRARVARWLAGGRRLAALDAALESGGFRLVFLLRLSPLLPFNLLNYALALTRVRWRDYLLATWLGMLPATVVYVNAGAAAASVLEATTRGPQALAGVPGRVLALLGVVATLAATWLITRLARRSLQALLPPEAGAR